MKIKRSNQFVLISAPKPYLVAEKPQLVAAIQEKPQLVAAIQ
jgi:hypothetical protein